MTTIRAVVFDMDGLLLDTERVALETYLEAASELGIDASADLYTSFIGRTWHTTQVLINETLGTADASRMIDRWKEKFHARLARQPIPKKPGTDELLALIGRLRLPTALATSTARPQAMAQLRSAGLVGSFGAIATGDEVAEGKPAPEIFMLAASRLGVDPVSCIALEDSETGVEAASRAGMRVIMVPDLVQPTEKTRLLTEYVCGTLAEVCDLFHRILAPGKASAPRS